MPYYTTTEVAKLHNISSHSLLNILNSKSCIYKNPKNKKQWAIYDSFTEGVKSPIKRCGNAILWSHDMLPVISNVVDKTKMNKKSSIVKNVKDVSTTSCTEDDWYLRKYFDKSFGEVFQMTRQTKGPGHYASFNDKTLRYQFCLDSSQKGIRSNGRKKTKLITSNDPSFNKWDKFLSDNRII